MEPPDYTELWSADRRYGVRIQREVLGAILGMCAQAGSVETGGILVGRYNREHSCAQVTRASPAPTDSRSGKNWFVRGVRGLQRWINTLWCRGEYYLGEWHFHPGAARSASGRDSRQMLEIAQSFSYRCPEPILVIIAGDPHATWYVNALVFPRCRVPIELVIP